MVQWLRFRVPKAGGPGSIPDQGTRCHMPQLRANVATHTHTQKGGSMLSLARSSCYLDLSVPSMDQTRGYGSHVLAYVNMGVTSQVHLHAHRSAPIHILPWSPALAGVLFCCHVPDFKAQLKSAFFTQHRLSYLVPRASSVSTFRSCYLHKIVITFNSAGSGVSHLGGIWNPG